MIVCHCHGISDRAIRRAVQSGAETRREVSRACGAGVSCGACRPAIREIISTARVTPGSARLARRHAYGVPLVPLEAPGAGAK